MILGSGHYRPRIHNYQRSRRSFVAATVPLNKPTTKCDGFVRTTVFVLMDSSVPIHIGRTARVFTGNPQPIVLTPFCFQKKLCGRHRRSDGALCLPRVAGSPKLSMPTAWRERPARARGPQWRRARTSADYGHSSPHPALHPTMSGLRARRKRDR